MNPTKVLADQTAAVLGLFGDLSREEAARLLLMYAPYKRLCERSADAADELRDLVLDRFPTSEPPCVPGLDFLAVVEQDAKTIVAEVVAEPVRHGLGSADKGSDGLYRRCLCGEEFTGRDLADLADQIMAHERAVQS